MLRWVPSMMYIVGMLSIGRITNAWPRYPAPGKDDDPPNAA